MGVPCGAKSRGISDENHGVLGSFENGPALGALHQLTNITIPRTKLEMSCTIAGMVVWV